MCRLEIRYSCITHSTLWLLLRIELSVGSEYIFNSLELALTISDTGQ